MRVAQSAYEIDFGAKRALDDMMNARSILGMEEPDVDLRDPIKLADVAEKYARFLKRSNWQPDTAFVRSERRS